MFSSRYLLQIAEKDVLKRINLKDNISSIVMQFKLVNIA